MNQEVVLILFQVVVLVLAFSVHECAHAWVAWKLGDPTGKMLGRVTLNPLKHLDPLGSVFMPLLALVYHWPLIGWAKPTPVTARNFKNYKRDDILVTLAGPVSNLAMATVALVLLIILKHVVAGGLTAVATAVALETLNIYEEMNIVGHVQAVGPRLIAGLHVLADHPIVGHADGVGLIAGLELVADKATRRPFSNEVKIGEVADRMARKHGLILRAIGNRLALSPPLIITRSEIDELLLRLRRTLDDTAAEADKFAV